MPWPTSATVALPEGVTASTGELDDALANGLRALEAATNRVPFRAAVASSSNPFDPPDGLSGRYILDTKGFISISSIVSDGRALTQGVDWFVIAYGPEVGGEKPIDSIAFVRAISCKRQSLVITGVRGSYVNCPADVSKALKRFARAEVVEDSAAPFGEIRREKIGDREIEYQTNSVTTVSALAKGDREAFDQVASRYLLVAING